MYWLRCLTSIKNQTWVYNVNLCIHVNFTLMHRVSKSLTTLEELGRLFQANNNFLSFCPEITNNCNLRKRFQSIVFKISAPTAFLSTLAPVEKTFFRKNLYIPLSSFSWQTGQYHWKSLEFYSIKNFIRVGNGSISLQCPTFY